MKSKTQSVKTRALYEALKLLVKVVRAGTHRIARRQARDLLTYHLEFPTYQRFARLRAGSGSDESTKEVLPPRGERIIKREALLNESREWLAMADEAMRRYEMANDGKGK